MANQSIVNKDQTHPFIYNDKLLKDKQPLKIFVNSHVFFPTSTTSLILRAFRRSILKAPESILDLGCGCGIVAIVLGSRILPPPKLYASDISEAAVYNTLENAKSHNLDIDCRHGSLFNPWNNMRFDIIITDVPGISEPIARKTKWYPPTIPCDSGEDGGKWITQVLEEAPKHLNSDGKIFFPVGSLSNEIKIMQTARKHFKTITLLEEILYPLDDDLLKAIDLVNSLVSKNVISVKQHGSRICWSAKVFEAYN